MEFNLQSTEKQLNFDMKPHREHEFESHEDTAQNDFKLLIKYVKLWKKYIKRQKQKRREKKIEMEHLIKSIDFHEKHLILKSIRSFRRFKIKRMKLDFSKLRVQTMVDKNLQIFYFKSI
jgi:hypothetical protein